MLKYFTIFPLFFLSVVLQSQSVFNTELIREVEYSQPNKKLDVLILIRKGFELPVSKEKDITIHYQLGNIYSVTASIASIKELATQKQVVRIEYVKHDLKLMGDTCVVRNRVKDIKLGTSPLTQPYDGTGVIVGIIDSGTDFNHPDFKDANGNSRIKFLWDMTKPFAVNTPTTFGYGQEWNNTEIDLGQCTHDDLAHFGHGTNSSGIAAGNGLAINHFEGVAPKADLIVVALNFNRFGFVIADAVQYIVSKAQLLNKPLVINASVGDYFGSHDGTDLESHIIDNMISNVPGRALVASAGNAGSVPFHVGYPVVNTDTSFAWIYNTSVYTAVSEYADTLNMKQVQYRVSATNLSLNDLGSTSFKTYNYALNTLKRDTIYHHSDRIGIIESVASINSSGVYELSLNIIADSLGYLWGIEHTGNGRIDSWSFSYVSGGLPTAAEYPRITKCKLADTLQTIVSGFQCSDEVITVGNYVNRNSYKDVNNITQTTTETPGKLSGSSSSGPTRDNRIKPDIVASGSTILTCAVTAMLPNLIANSPQVVAKGGFHVTAGGTSASSPVVAGMVALYLQKNPTATNRQIKEAIINCAYSDVFTSTNLPNYQWGYGKLDGFRAMTCGVVFTGIDFSGADEGMSLFPNPFIQEATITFKNDDHKTIKLYNAAGQLVFLDECEASSYVIRKNNLPSGVYLLQSEEKQVVHRTKIVIL